MQVSFLACLDMTFLAYHKFEKMRKIGLREYKASSVDMVLLGTQTHSEKTRISLLFSVIAENEHLIEQWLTNENSILERML